MVKVSTGSYDLNKWLFGGYDNDIVSVIYGSSGTGKTNFCLQAAVSQAKKGNKVIFIDTEGGFSVERVKQLAPEEYKSVLTNIFLLTPTNFSEQKKAFGQLAKYLREDSNDSISLVVVDGMTILYRLDFAAARERDESEIRKINSDLADQMRTLAEVARKRNIPVIITNQVYRWDDSDKMVGGDILKYWGKCHIELVNEKGRRTAHLRKHRSLPEKYLAFQITNSGVKKRGWI